MKEADSLYDRTNQLLKASQSLAHVGGWELDLVTSELFWTSETYYIHDTTPEVFNPALDAGIHFYEPESREILIEALKAATEKGEGYDLELDLRTTKGRLIHVHTTCEVTLYNGKPVKLTGAIQDITESKKLQKELIYAKEQAEKSEQFLNNIINRIGDPLFVKDDKSRLVLVNDSFCDLFQLSRINVLGNTLVENVSNDERKHFLRVDRGVLSSGKESIEEETLTLNHGETQTISTHKTRYIDKEGKKFLIGTIHDFTERKRREVEQKKLFEKYQLAIKAAKLGVWIFDVASKKVEWNDELLNMYGLTPTNFDETIQRFENYVYPDDVEVLRRQLARVLHGESVFAQLFRIIRHGREVRHIEASATPIYDENNQLIQLVGINRDVTLSKKAETDLIQAKKRAEDSDRLKTAFLANMSHEIRTPMNGVVGFADLLKNENLSAEIRNQYLGIIDSNSKQLLNLIDDILDMAKIESNELKINQTSCEVVSLLMDLEATYNQLKLQNNKAEIEFIARVPKQWKRLTLITDGFRIRQVLSNLLSNALKFSEKGIISFGFEVLGKEVVFFVKDQGIGIPKEEINTIFSRFKQIDSKMKVHSGGAGLGLTICKGIIHLLGGTILVRSEVNVGSEFTFSIPYTEADAKSVIKFKDKKQNKSLVGKTLLIAEDGATARFYFKESLRESKVHLLFATNGQIAVNLFSEHPEIDLVLMDIDMPIMNGFEAMDKIFKINPKAKIIAQSAYAMTNEKQKCFELGCLDYLTKPIRKEQLIETLGKWVE